MSGQPQVVPFQQPPNQCIIINRRNKIIILFVGSVANDLTMTTLNTQPGGKLLVLGGSGRLTGKKIKCSFSKLKGCPQRNLAVWPSSRGPPHTQTRLRELNMGSTLKQVGGVHRDPCERAPCNQPTLKKAIQSRLHPSTAPLRETTTGHPSSSSSTSSSTHPSLPLYWGGSLPLHHVTRQTMFGKNNVRAFSFFLSLSARVAFPRAERKLLWRAEPV